MLSKKASKKAFKLKPWQESLRDKIFKNGNSIGSREA